MMKPPVLFALAFTLIFNLPVVSNSTPEQPKNNTLDSATPVFAKVLDVKLGEDAECKLERRIGKGHETIGGHCNSGREWSFHNGLQLRADGFDLNHDGYILDTLIFSKWRGQLGDTKELAKFGLGVWGKLRVGMTQQECLQALPQDMLKPMTTADKLVWHQDVSGTRDGQPGMFQYEAALEFTRGRLKSVFIDIYFRAN